MDLSPLQRKRLRYQPTLPDCLAAETHLFKFTVVDPDIDKPWREEQKEELEEEAKKKKGESTARREQRPPRQRRHIDTPVVATDEPPLTPADAHSDLGDHGGRVIDVSEYFPYTAATPVYHVVPGPALAGAGLAASERVKPLRMVRYEAYHI